MPHCVIRSTAAAPHTPSCDDDNHKSHFAQRHDCPALRVLFGNRHSYQHVLRMTLLALACMLPQLFFCMTATAEENENSDGLAPLAEGVLRGRHRALVYALTQRPATAGNPATANNADDTSRRFRVLCRSMVHEGGFLRQEAASALGIDTSPVGQIARAFHELDGDKSKLTLQEPPDPVLSSALMALCYSQPSVDGLRAAKQCAGLIDDDKRTQESGAVTYMMLSSCLSGENDKQTILNDASAVTDDEYVGRMVRSVRLQEWSKLHGEEKALGRLQRALSIWYHTDSAQQANELGHSQLQTQSAQKLLSAFTAAYYGELPQAQTANAAKPITTNQKNVNSAETADLHKDQAEMAELAADLYQMAEEGFVLPVPEAVAPAPATHRTTATPSASAPATLQAPTIAAPELIPPTPPARPAIASVAPTTSSGRTPAGNGKNEILPTPSTPATPATPQTPATPVTPDGNTDTERE